MTKLRKRIIQEILVKFPAEFDNLDDKLKAKVKARRSNEQLLKDAEKELKCISMNYHPRTNRALEQILKRLLKPKLKNARFYQRIDDKLEELTRPEELSDRIREVYKYAIVLTTSSHSSLWDPVFARYASHHFGLPVFHMRTGSNLYKGPSKSILCSINSYRSERGKTVNYLNKFLLGLYEIHCTKLAHEVDSFHPFIFITNGRPRDGYISETSKIFNPKMFENLIKLQLENPELDVRVLTISQSYTVVAEAKSMTDGKVPDKNDKRDVMSYFVRSRQKKPVYVVLSEPKKIFDYISKETIETKNIDKAVEEFATGVLDGIKHNFIFGLETLFCAVAYKVYEDLGKTDKKIPGPGELHGEFLKQKEYLNSKSNLVPDFGTINLDNFEHFNEFYNKMIKFCIGDGRIHKKEQTMNLGLMKFYYNNIRDLMHK